MRPTNRNPNYFTLLTGYKPFKDFVRDLRVELNIPQQGLKSNKEMKEWTDGNDKASDEYYFSDKYKRMVRDIRKKFKDGELDEVMANKQLGVLDTMSPINKLNNACKYIMRNFNIPSNFYLSLSEYILQNKMTFVPLQNFAYIPDLSEKERIATIVIHAKLQKEELTDLTKLIKELNKKLPTVSKVSDTFMKKLSIEDWKKNSHVFDEQLSASEIVKESLGKKATTQQLYDAPRIVKKKREKLFGQTRT